MKLREMADYKTLYTVEKEDAEESLAAVQELTNHLEKIVNDFLAECKDDKEESP